MKKRRVVITGLGVIALIGVGKDEFWKARLNTILLNSFGVGNNNACLVFRRFKK